VIVGNFDRADSLVSSHPHGPPQPPTQPFDPQQVAPSPNPRDYSAKRCNRGSLYSTARVLRFPIKPISRAYAISLSPAQQQIDSYLTVGRHVSVILHRIIDNLNCLIYSSTRSSGPPPGPNKKAAMLSGPRPISPDRNSSLIRRPPAARPVLTITTCDSQLSHPETPMAAATIVFGLHAAHD